MTLPFPSVAPVSPMGVQPTLVAARAATSAASTGDFASVLYGIVSATLDDVRTAETTATAGLTGAASAQQVVEAVGSAEDGLNITLAIRNRAVAAYQEIEHLMN